MADGRRVLKKKAAPHPHHGGAWKVAYADFVTAMMALFMVMWLLASTDQKSRQEISRYFRTGILPEGDMAMNRAAQTKPSVIEEAGRPAAPKKATSLEESRALGKAIEQLFKTDPELAKLAAQVSISTTEEGVLIEAVDRDGQSMLFDLASSALKPALVAFLSKLGPMLAERQSQIRIMGHTDARPFVSRSGKTNWDLSYERATNARRVLEASGLARGQVTSVQAHGASQPRNAADPLAAENRRLAVLVMHAPQPAEEQSPADAKPAHAAGAPAEPGPAAAEIAPAAAQPAPESAQPPTADSVEKPAAPPALGEPTTPPPIAKPAAPAEKPAAPAAPPATAIDPSATTPRN